MPASSIKTYKKNGYEYIDQGPSSDLPPLVLLHGMLGDLSNWGATIDRFAANRYRVIAPVLPVYDLPLSQTSVPGLAEYVRGFLRSLGIGPAVLIGNSLGGQVALIYALRYPEIVSAMILSGASGIYEVAIGTGTPRRRSRDFIRERAAVTFYDPVHVTDELVDDLYEIVNDRARAIRLIRMARSAQSETVVDELSAIDTPTLLVWGRDDMITPPDVADKFLEHLPNAELHFIDACGHAPMIEHPDTFNDLALDFLRRHVGTTTLEPTSSLG